MSVAGSPMMRHPLVGKDAFVIRSPFRVALAALLLIPALTGCSPGSHPVARVGDRTLTVDDFTQLARGNESKIPGPPEQAKAMMLQELVRRELVALAAHKHGYDTVSTARDFEKTTRETQLVQELYRQLAPPDVAVSEGELRAFYQSRAVQGDAHLIYNSEKPLVLMALGALQRGVEFSEVARQYNTPNTLPPGGAIGLVSPGDLFPPLDEALRTLPLNTVGGPYESPKGWFLLMVSKRQAAQLQPFETQRAMLEQMVRQRKVAAAQSRALLALENEYHLVIPEGAAQSVFRLLAPARAADAPHWMPDSAERLVPLATYKGGAYTMGEAFDDLMAGRVQGPDATVISSCAEWVRGQATQRIALLEAARRHIAEEPVFAHSLHDKVSAHVLQAEAMQAVSNTPPPSEEQARAAWESVKSQYPQLRSAHLVWISTNDTTVAGAVLRAAASGGSLRDVAGAVAPSVPVHEETVTFPTEDPVWGSLQNTLSQMQPGQWSPPQYTNDGLRILQMVSHDASPLSWEQLPAGAKENVARSIGQRAQQEHFQAYLDSLWQATKPVLMPENLRSLPWPLPATADVEQ
jgi:peptidyl-prolyl cis-trans isomerase C